jgi:hypothetical protein
VKRIVAGVACLVLAAAAVLLARDAWRWDDALRDGDLRVESSLANEAAWAADETVPGGAARRVLGIEDDLRFRRAMLRGAHLAADPPSSPKEAGERAPFLTELARLERDEPAQRASAAANLLGVLLYLTPEDPDQRQQSPAEKSLFEFQTAVRLDPSNDRAKTNLQIVLEQQRTDAPQGRSSPGGGSETGQGAAGLSEPGGGY